MSDADFDLMKVSDEELFFALRGEIFNIIKNLQGHKDIEIDDMQLDKANATRRKAYGKDYNLYPQIVLPVQVKEYLGIQEFYLILNSFEISLLTHQDGIKMIANKDLTRIFHEYMASRFPESRYFEKRNDYFRNAKVLKRIEDEELFN